LVVVLVSCRAVAAPRLLLLLLLLLLKLRPLLLNRVNPRFLLLQPRLRLVTSPFRLPLRL
jgi:hypothetical protein